MKNPAHPPAALLRARSFQSRARLTVAGLVFGSLALQSPAVVVPPTDNSAAPYMGIYGWGLMDSGIPHNERTAAWLYRSSLFAQGFTGYGSWTAIEGEAGALNGARNWLAQNPGSTYSYTVAMLPGFGATPLAGTSLANGATGAYDAHFATLAGRLVDKGLANNIIIRLGHEFNGDWYPWKVRNATDAASYAAYWRKIVAAMRAVPGTENLKFEWCGIARVWTSYPIADAYPGDEYVDYIGVDVYDKCSALNTYDPPYPDGLTPAQLQTRRNTAWGYISGTLNNNMGAWRNFAASRGKPFTLPEWGVSANDYGGKDNPVFIQKMYEFIHDPANNVHYHSYFDVQAPDGHHQLTRLPNGQATEFPEAAAVFRKRFGLPPFALDDDIGSTGLAGGGTVTIFSGAGAGLPTGSGATADAFHLSSRTITGDDAVQVKITALPADPAAQTGLMLRQGTASNAVYAALLVANGKCVFQSRTAAGVRAVCNTVTNDVALPVWLKLVREGDVITGYRSGDGLNWLEVDRRTVAMAGAVRLGVAVGSGSVTTLATAEIDEVDYIDFETNLTPDVENALIVDNAAPGVTLTGAWTASTSPAGFYGSNYIHDGNTGKGTKSVRFAPTLGTAGRYDVYTRWVAAYNRADNAPVSVISPAGTVTQLANQQLGRDLWLHLGGFDFNAGSGGSVLVENTGTIYHTNADAVMFVPRPVPAGPGSVADVHARNGTYANDNYGTSATLEVKNDAISFKRDAFLHFDVSGLASSKLVLLQLTPVSTGTDASATYTVELVTDDTWTEGGVTWNTKPAGSGVVLGQLAGLQAGVPVRIDLTNQVKTEAAGDGFISLRIYGDAPGSQKFASFGPRENVNAANRPQLLVQ